nr:redoxin domain-containing protein [Salsuginibacillus kocurii]
MRTVLIGLVLAAMLGWTLFDTFFTSEEAPADEDFDIQEDTESGSGAGGALEEGDPAPDFTLETLTGETVSLSDYEGRPVFLNFWATWCPPCRAEMPDMERFYEAYDMEILAVNLRENAEEVQSFVEELGLTFPILMDENVEVADAYNVQPIPTSYFIDSDGIIRHMSIGPMNKEMMVNEYQQLD